MKCFDIQRSADEEIYRVYKEDHLRFTRRVMEMMKKIGKIKAGQNQVVRRFDTASSEGSWRYNITLAIQEYKPAPNLRYSYDLSVWSVVNDSFDPTEKNLVIWPSVLKEEWDYEEIILLRSHSVSRYFERTGLEAPDSFLDKCSVLMRSEFESSPHAFNFFDFPTYREHRLRTKSGVFLGRGPDTGQGVKWTKQVQQYNTFVSDTELNERDSIIQGEIKKDGKTVKSLDNLNRLMNLSNAELKKLENSGVDLNSLGLNIV